MATWRRRRFPLQRLLLLIASLATLGSVILYIKTVDPSSPLPANNTTLGVSDKEVNIVKQAKKCATVEEMGEIFGRGYPEESLRVRRIIHDHFALNGALTVRELPQHQFCKHGFVIGKASEAGLGNEMYKILTAAAVSVMLNRSLIIGQTRHILYPFGNYISYSNLTFTMKEVKHLWRKNRCLAKYGRHLTMRIDDFQKPALTNVLCSNWGKWQEPIIWFQNATDAVAAQFFLKNIHPEMKEAASYLFGRPEDLQHRANVFGELMRVLIFPSKTIERAVNWALNGSQGPDIVLHMRMMMNRSVRARQAALDCVKKTARDISMTLRPKLVLVTDTPSLVKDIVPTLEEYTEVVHFDYKKFELNISGNNEELKLNGSNFRVKDWGPAPRWVAFVDFFLASRAKHAVISGAHRRVGTTYIQLIAALAAAYKLDENSSSQSVLRFISSFQSNLLSEGLKNQVGWGHVWNRFAGPLSCRSRSNQCALTPILAPAWWDGLWQSPIPRDIRRMEAYGIKLSGFGTSNDDYLNKFCRSRKTPVVSVPLI
ncbi:hypothetical protein F511_09306 [Dorcoceras hygrometricum]|uniref:Uncharacterized protein n=1 Tax=Dorcoceras hygrometricum TaxID=472368 RepID=A0A2Z7C8W1_9LAMI|nr:hypothetical protein F511_09306 [Dorcoceras hygrometricum]